MHQLNAGLNPWWLCAALLCGTHCGLLEHKGQLRICITVSLHLSPPHLPPACGRAPRGAPQ